MGLERIQGLLGKLGDPHHQVPIIHVAGSNGKGSVCAYLSSILTCAGYQVGRYTSPHLIDWNERIVVNEQPIPSMELLNLIEQVQAVIPLESKPPTQFELITAAAWLHFARLRVDVAVMEVGLGGRLDATNVCDHPLISIITSISREHWQILGDTLGAIAHEKAGILKPGCLAIVGSLPMEAQVVIKERVAQLGCQAVFPSPTTIIESPNGSVHPWGECQGVNFPLPLAGKAQLYNSALAMGAIHHLRCQGWQISDTAIQQGMANTRWPGRLQWTTWHECRWLVDGAHNPASAQVLRDYVDSYLEQIHGNNLDGQRVSWVMGMMATKDHREIFQALLRPGDSVFLVPVPDSDSAPPEMLMSLVNSMGLPLFHCQTYPDLHTALITANGFSHSQLRVLCGSLYLIGHLCL